MMSPGGVAGQEIIAWTNIPGNSLTGITRGDYGSTAQAYAGNSTASQLNPGAIANFYTDGVHWTEQSQYLVARVVAQALSTATSSSNLATNAARIGPGRADVRCSLSCSAQQLMN